MALLDDVDGAKWALLHYVLFAVIVIHVIAFAAWLYFFVNDLSKGEVQGAATTVSAAIKKKVDASVIVNKRAALFGGTEKSAADLDDKSLRQRGVRPKPAGTE